MNTGAPVDHERRALQKGTRVQEFEILGLVGSGGFGIVYLAHDQSLERRVALKEYMPPLASRAEGTTEVIVSSPEHAVTFGTGLRSFVNEARLLARFDHPALVKVHRFWEENGTAYMVMPFYDGPTLQRAIAEKLVATDETSLRLVLFPLLDALMEMHSERCFHRDISPDNILLTATGPVLLDFGAARLALSDASQNFTVILKEGYAPVEQYATENAAEMRQGPWTDIYALSGVVRYAITGKKPPSAVARMASRNDPLEPLTQTATGRYSEPFLRAIDTGMALFVEDRPQSIAQFRALLGKPPVILDGITRQRPAPALSEDVTVKLAGPTVQEATTVTLDPFPLPSITPEPVASSGSAAHQVPLYADRPSWLRWSPVLLAPAAVAAAVIAYRVLPLGQNLHTQAPSAMATASSTDQPQSSSARQEAPRHATARSPEPPAQVSGGPPPVVSTAAVPATAGSPAASPETAGTGKIDAPHPAPPARVDTEEEGPSRPGPRDWHGARAVSPALALMLKAARASAWGAVERRAMLIARTDDPVPAGDRSSSRRANELGLAALRTHQYTEAVAAFEAGTGLDPSDIEVANNYGYALLLAGRRAEAQRVLSDVLLRDPARAVAWTAFAEARSEDSAVALTALKIALHFAASRERTLARFREMAQSHPDPRVRELVAKVLAQRDRVPTVPEGLP
jgi:serine/threonine protein kinase